ncbi:citramalyl-CoA lyase, mitochondrial-like [Babylonia areolata]|uniref:citramalyl-CoA lyase, mitochondrial-like n=1 Tax=Babylonia areolata TaxID=304850 RepID=UPI003FD2C865
MNIIKKAAVVCGKLARNPRTNFCHLLLQDGSCSKIVVPVAVRRRYSSVGNLDTDRRYVPRRTLLYIPGHDLRKLRKVPELDVDCAVLECEDGVAHDMKAEARKNICMMLDELGEVEGMDIAVRVNSVGSGLMNEDLKVIMKAHHLPQTILLPKVDTVDDVVLFTSQFRSAVGSRTGGYCPHLITYVESAEGLRNMEDVLDRAQDFSKQGIYHLDGVVFGSDDFCADIGAMRTTDALELTYVRQKIVTIARGHRIQAIDMVYIDYKDLEGLRLQSEEGARDGYTGKQIIHPNQAATVREAFTPSPERVDWATKLIEAFEQHQKSGQGAFIFRGHMIDRPLLLQARNVLQTVENVKKTPSK